MAARKLSLKQRENVERYKARGWQISNPSNRLDDAVLPFDFDPQYPAYIPKESLQAILTPSNGA